MTTWTELAPTLVMVGGSSMEIVGLVLNIVGVVILAYAQNALDRTVRLWLMALDFSVETILESTTKPTVRIRGMDEQMKNTLTTNRWLTTGGWALVAVGFILQLIALQHH
jgi:hypothetical protein